MPDGQLRAILSKMAAERTTCIMLVAEVEKYPLLFNYKLPEYSRKDLTEKAWTEIANKIKLTAAECKDKWRNIRCTFTRSLKGQPSGSKTKKPYYLSEYLTFVLPYVKPLNESGNRGNIPPTPVTLDAETTSDVETTEQISDNSQIVSPQPHQPPASPAQSTSSDSQMSQSTHGVRRRKTPASEIDAAMINFLTNKTKKTEDFLHSTNKNEQQMSLFFQSLIPEFTDMSGKQIRNFKIQVLQLIDKIKATPPQSDATPCTSRESHYTVYSPISSVGSPAMTNYRHETSAQINYESEPRAPINYQSELSPGYQNQTTPINFSAQIPFNPDVPSGSRDDHFLSDFNY